MNVHGMSVLSILTRHRKTNPSNQNTLQNLSKEIAPKVNCVAFTHRTLINILPGRVPRQSPKSSPQSSAAAAQLRTNRKNSAKQCQIKKRQELVSATRLFNGINGTSRIVAIVPLSQDVSARSIAQVFAKALDVDSESCPAYGTWKLKFVR